MIFIKKHDMEKDINKSCFVIMPISDCEGYEKGHFGRVYEDIIKPSVEMSGYNSIRADEVKETNLIHLDILKKLLDAPIAVCDLSTRNPNVLFELGIRQAFDKPVVLIQEKGTPKIFDITPLRYLEYSKEMKYHEVIDSQQRLKEAIEATQNAEGDAGSVNSIVKLLALNTSATIPNLDKSNKEFITLDYIQSQMTDMRMMMEMVIQESRKPNSNRSSIAAIEYERISSSLDKLTNMKVDPLTADKEFSILLRETEELMMNCRNEIDHRMFGYLRERIRRQRSAYLSTR